MIFLLALLSFAPGIVSGLGLANLLWPQAGRAALLVKIFLAPGIGLGIMSCLQFFWILVFTPASPGFFWLESALAGGLAVAALRIRGKMLVQKHQETLAAHPNRTIQTGAVIMLCIVLLSGSLELAGRTLANPNGNFDAYATWNLRARAIYLSPPADWKAAFSPDLSWKVHADYPLMWPLTILRSWQAIGETYPQAGQVLTILFGLATAGLLFSGLLFLSGFLTASLGTIVLVCMPWFQTYNAYQQSDGPLTYFYLAAVVLLLVSRRREYAGLLALCGMAGGLAAWTKNEGMVFLLAAAVMVWVGGYQAAKKDYPLRPWRASVRGLLPFLGGAALPLAAVLVFKLVLAPPGDLVGSQSLDQLLVKALDPSRWGVILGATMQILPQLGGWSWPVFWILPLGLLLPGWGKPPAGIFIGMIPALTLIGYLVVYLVTPHDLVWHLQFSLERLMYHLLVPAVVILLCLLPPALPGFPRPASSQQHPGYPGADQDHAVR